MHTPRQFLQKIIRMRSHVLDNKKHKANEVRCWMAIKALKPWLDGHPKATDSQVAAHMYRHYNAIQTILPRGNNPHVKDFQIEFHTILNQYTNANLPQYK